MKYQVKETRNRVVMISLVTLSALLAVSIIGNSITGALAWHFYRTQKTITTPMMFDRPFTSTASAGDAALNSMMARSLLNLRFSVTPETVDAQHAALLRWVPADSRPELKKALAAEAEYIKKNGVSTVFRIDEETIDPQTGDITARGTLSASTSNGSLSLSLPDVNKSYSLNMGYVDGQIRLTAFVEIPPAPSNGKINRE